MEHLKSHRGINADEIRNLALEEAAQAAYNALFPTNDRSDWTELAESAAYHAKYACQCIRALKTQADKDGGQQRAVNPSEPTCPRCTLPLRQECNCDEGYAARAALSSPQAEQGERDA